MANYLHCVIILSFLGSLLQIVLLGNNIFSFHHLSLAITLYHAVSSRQICVQVSEVLHRFTVGQSCMQFCLIAKILKLGF